LLTLLLATHPDIGTIGERGHYYRKMMVDPIVGSPLCSCGEPFRQCDFWRGVKARVDAELPAALQASAYPGFQLGHRLPKPLRRRLNRVVTDYMVNRSSMRLPRPIRTRYQAMLDANAILIRAVLAQSDATVFLDSSKAIDHALHLNQINGFAVKVLHLVRDGRGQVSSTLKHHPQQTITQAAERWVKQIENQRSLLRAAQMPHRIVRYEDLCADPRLAVDEALAFCGLDDSAATLNVTDTPLHIMGNPVRLRGIEAIEDKQEWRESLQSDQLDAFERIAGDLNRDLGYS
jgi:hypothetical protein